MTKRFSRSRHLHDGVLVDGVRVDTVFHRESILGFVLLNILLLPVSMHGYQDPKVDIIIRNDGEKEMLYSEGPYRARKVGTRIDEVTDRIREVGVDQFLSEVASTCGPLYCDRRHAYLCPVCDVWLDDACVDPACPHCPGRPAVPSACEDAERRYSRHD